MKKFMLSTLVLVLLGFVSVNAEAFTEKGSTGLFQEETKTEVKVEELPEAVITGLTTEDNKGWTITKAYLVKKGETEYYSIELTGASETETKTVKLNKDGEKI